MSHVCAGLLSREDYISGYRPGTISRVLSGLALIQHRDICKSHFEQDLHP